MVLQGESLKAKAYVTHSASIGVLREKMVRQFVRHETPDAFRVETGIIRNHARGKSSPQCDLLVHDGSYTPPLYRWEDFVIAHSNTVKAVVEVKSILNAVEFKKILGINRSVLAIERNVIPTFGYGLTGVTFSTFVQYVKNAVKGASAGVKIDNRFLNWPFCIAVQSRGYLGIRPLVYDADSPAAFFVLDFKKANNSKEAIEGIETGMFLHLYSEFLQQGSIWFHPDAVKAWFNQMPISKTGKAWISQDGKIHYGDKP